MLPDNNIEQQNKLNERKKTAQLRQALQRGREPRRSNAYQSVLVFFRSHAACFALFDERTLILPSRMSAANFDEASQKIFYSFNHFSTGMFYLLVTLSLFRLLVLVVHFSLGITFNLIFCTNRVS